MQTTHYDLNLAFDLERQVARGYVDIDVCVSDTNNGSVTELILDAHHLSINAVSLQSSSEDASGNSRSSSPLSHELKPFTNFGSALHIDVSSVTAAKQTGGIFQLRIAYETVRDSMLSFGSSIQRLAVYV